MKKLVRGLAAYAYRNAKAIYLRLYRGEVANKFINIKDNGFLYIVTGGGYAEECLFSIKSLKKFNDEKVCVFAPEEYRDLLETECEYFFAMDSKLQRPKVEFISQSPFKNTVYLDSDTYIDQNISDLFLLLEKYDFGGAFCNSRKRENYSKLISKYRNIPYSFSEVNTGVMVFNNSASVRDLFINWKKYYYDYLPKTNGWDQPSFRVALWESNVKLCHLPPEYNVRPKSVYEKVRKNKRVLGELHMEPRIFHTHHSPEVHHGKFKVETLEELRELVEELSTDIVY
jgi:hypothetical protein